MNDDEVRFLQEYFRNSQRMGDIVGILLRMSETLNLMKWILVLLALNAIELGTLTAMTIWLIGG